MMSESPSYQQLDPDSSQHDQDVEGRISELEAERDHWQARSAELEVQLERERQHVQALLDSLTQARQSGPASQPVPEFQEEEEPLVDIGEESLNELLGRGPEGSRPQLSEGIERCRRWVSQRF